MKEAYRHTKSRSFKSNSAGEMEGLHSIVFVEWNGVFKASYERIDPLDIRRHIEFPFQSCSIHRTNLSEYLPLSSGMVVSAEAPGDSGKTIRIAAIKFIFIIERKHRVKSLFRTFTPPPS